MQHLKQTCFSISFILTVVQTLSTRCYEQNKLAFQRLLEKKFEFYKQTLYDVKQENDPLSELLKQ